MDGVLVERTKTEKHVIPNRTSEDVLRMHHASLFRISNFQKERKIHFVYFIYL